MTFTGSTCGLEHDLARISLGADAPAQWNLLTEDERSLSELTGEQCVIRSSEGTDFFVRACLEIPILGSQSAFTWGVWCSLSEKSFLEMSKHWHGTDRIKLGPYFGWLCTPVPEYADTMFMKTRVHQREVGLRPLVELEESEHLLSVHYHRGIPEQEMQRIVSRVLHEQ